MDSSTEIFIFDKVMNRINSINCFEIDLAVRKIVGDRRILDVSDVGDGVFRVNFRDAEDFNKILTYPNFITIKNETYAFATNDILFKRGNVWVLAIKVFKILNSRCKLLGLKIEELWSCYGLKVTRERENGGWLIKGHEPNVNRFVEKIRMILLYDSYFPDDDEEYVPENSFDDENSFNSSIDVAGASQRNAEQNVSIVTDEDCSICLNPMDGMKSIERLKNCSHVFHKECLQEWLKKKSCCPYCTVKNDPERGTQPEGGFFLKEFVYGRDIAGFNDAIGYIRITYYIPDGIQEQQHPNPGWPYSGIQRVAYLPNNERALDIANLLEVAFDRGFTFNVGTSMSTGESNAIVWNPSILHKTSLSGGGPYGYPDNLYLDLVEMQLKDLGIDKSHILE